MEGKMEREMKESVVVVLEEITGFHHPSEDGNEKLREEPNFDQLNFDQPRNHQRFIYYGFPSQLPRESIREKQKENQKEKQEKKKQEKQNDENEGEEKKLIEEEIEEENEEEEEEEKNSRERHAQAIIPGSWGLVKSFKSYLVTYQRFCCTFLLVGLKHLVVASTPYVSYDQNLESHVNFVQLNEAMEAVNDQVKEVVVVIRQSNARFSHTLLEHLILLWPKICIRTICVDSDYLLVGPKGELRGIQKLRRTKGHDGGKQKTFHVLPDDVEDEIQNWFHVARHVLHRTLCRYVHFLYYFESHASFPQLIHHTFLKLKMTSYLHLEKTFGIFPDTPFHERCRTLLRCQEEKKLGDFPLHILLALSENLFLRPFHMFRKWMLDLTRKKYQEARNESFCHFWQTYSSDENKKTCRAMTVAYLKSCKHSFVIGQGKLNSKNARLLKKKKASLSQFNLLVNLALQASNWCERLFWDHPFFFWT